MPKPLASSIHLQGLQVETVRAMTAAECRAEGWDPDMPRPSVVVFDNGAKLYASRDPEGNGPGALFGIAAGGTSFRV